MDGGRSRPWGHLSQVLLAGVAVGALYLLLSVAHRFDVSYSWREGPPWRCMEHEPNRPVDRPRVYTADEWAAGVQDRPDNRPRYHLVRTEALLSLQTRCVFEADDPTTRPQRLVVDV